MNVLKAAMLPVAITTLLAALNYHEYGTMFDEYMRTASPEKRMGVALGTAGVGFGPFILAGLFKPLGLIADRARVKKLPEEAYSYTYGIESILRIKSGEYFRSHRGGEEQG